MGLPLRVAVKACITGVFLSVMVMVAVSGMMVRLFPLVLPPRPRSPPVPMLPVECELWEVALESPLPPPHAANTAPPQPTARIQGRSEVERGWYDIRPRYHDSRPRGSA